MIMFTENITHPRMSMVQFQVAVGIEFLSITTFRPALQLTHTLSSLYSGALYNGINPKGNTTFLSNTEV
jgi:hypothetical protein